MTDEATDLAILEGDQDSDVPGPESFHVEPPSGSELAETGKSILPFLAGDTTDERKAEYLTYRFMGFSVREACEMTGIHQQTIKRWRVPGFKSKNGVGQYDPRFEEMEKAASGPERHAIRREIIQLTYTRNWTLVMKYDMQVIKLVLGMMKVDNPEDPDGEMITLMPTKQEIAYLNRMRGQYSAESIKAMEHLVDPGSLGDDFDYGKFLLRIQSPDGTKTEVGLSG